MTTEVTTTCDGGCGKSTKDTYNGGWISISATGQDVNVHFHACSATCLPKVFELTRAKCAGHLEGREAAKRHARARVAPEEER